MANLCYNKLYTKIKLCITTQTLNDTKISYSRRGVRNGEKYIKRLTRYEPTLYIPTNKETPHKSIAGEYLTIKEIQISESRETLEETIRQYRY